MAIAALQSPPFTYVREDPPSLEFAPLNAYTPASMLRPHHRHYLAGFFLDFGVMAAFTAMPFLIFNQLNGGAKMAGVIAGSQSIGYGLACLFLATGIIPMARLGLRAAAVGTALFAVLFCGATFLTQPLLYGVATTAGVSGMALVWPALHAWIGADPNIRRRGRRMARFNLSWSLGFTLGPFLGGPLYSLDYRLPFVASFALSTATFLILLAAPDERRYFGVAQNEPDAARFQHDRSSEVHLYAAWFANMVANAMVLVTRSVFPKRIDELVAAGELRLLFEDVPAAFLTVNPSTKFMWLAFAMAGTNAVTFLVLGRTHWWHHRFSFLAGLQVLAAAGFWMLGTTHSLIVMLFCCAAVGVAWGACFFAAVFYSVANPALKHRRAAVNEGAVGLGGFFGALAFGFLAERYSLVMPFHYTPVFVGIALLAQFFLLQFAVSRQRALAAS